MAFKWTRSKQILDYYFIAITFKKASQAHNSSGNAEIEFSLNKLDLALGPFDADRIKLKFFNFARTKPHPAPRARHL